MSLNKIQLYALAIGTYGIENQEQMAIEEMAELTQAICHKHRGRPNNIAEEIADVEIMLDQLKLINRCVGEVEKIKEQKIKRLAKRLNVKLKEVKNES